MYYAGVAETIGVRVNKLTPAQVKEIWPLCVTDGIIGAIQHPDDGYIQPADLTQAFAKGARAKGAEIFRNTRVTAIEETPSGEWMVRTDHGDIGCEHVVSCTGNFARLTGAMVGLDVPVIPVEHQYIVTEPHPAIVERQARGLPEMGVLREANSSWYMREENGGLLLGPLREGSALLLRRWAGGGKRIRTLPGRPRAARAAHRRPPSPACRHSARSASRRSTTAPSPTRPTAPRSSVRHGARRTSGSTRATRSASPPPGAPDGSSPNGSPTASRRST